VKAIIYVRGFRSASPRLLNLKVPARRKRTPINPTLFLNIKFRSPALAIVTQKLNFSQDQRTDHYPVAHTKYKTLLFSSSQANQCLPRPVACTETGKDSLDRRPRCTGRSLVLFYSSPSLYRSHLFMCLGDPRPACVQLVSWIPTGFQLFRSEPKLWEDFEGKSHGGTTKNLVNY
jgi:hypothetical protein